MRASIIDESGPGLPADRAGQGPAWTRWCASSHAVPNAWLPTMTLVFLNLGFVVGGAITIEYVYSINGLGSLTVDALQGPDVPLLQALFLLFSAAVIFANLVADLLYGVPRPAGADMSTPTIPDAPRRRRDPCAVVREADAAPDRTRAASRGVRPLHLAVPDEPQRHARSGHPRAVRPHRAARRRSSSPQSDARRHPGDRPAASSRRRCSYPLGTDDSGTERPRPRRAGAPGSRSRRASPRRCSRW